MKFIISLLVLATTTITLSHAESPPLDYHFCPLGTAHAEITFDFTRDFEVIHHGEYLTTTGHGFTLHSRKRDGKPRIYDTNTVGGMDPDLEAARVGNVVILQQQGVRRPNDSHKGGLLTFDFDVPTNIKSITLVDIEQDSGTEVLTIVDGEKLRFPAEVSGNGGVAETFLYEEDVDKLQVRFKGSGGVASLKMCLPKCGGEM